MKNHYQTLDLPTDASQDDIKRAYRKYASKFHPDKHKGDAFFEERFKDVLEAYEVLSDTERRAAYDERNKPKAPTSYAKQASPSAPKPSPSSKEKRAQAEEMKFGYAMPTAVRKKPISDLGWRLVKAAFVLEIIWMPFGFWIKSEIFNLSCIMIFMSFLALGLLLWGVGSLFKI